RNVVERGLAVLPQQGGDHPRVRRRRSCQSGGDLRCPARPRPLSGSGRDRDPPGGGAAPQSRQPRVRHDPVGVAGMGGGIAGSRPALPDPPALYRRPQAHRRIGATVRDAGHLPPDADTEAVAATLLSLMFGMIVMHHVVDDVPADALRTGVALLGAATRTAAPTTSPAKQTTP